MPNHGTEDVTADWFYEDQVVAALVMHLRSEGWSIGHLPSAQNKEQGVDITATRSGEVLLVEAKGFPSAFYRNETRRQEKKRTNPNNQAQQWYSHALLKALRLQTKHPSASVAMAFPDFPRYKQLFKETSGRLEILGIEVFFVGAEGIVSLGQPQPTCSSNSTFESVPVAVATESRTSSLYRGKYSGLSEFFQVCDDLEVCLSFAQLDSLVGRLPKSARTYREWWANHKSNPQSAWLAHGYKVVEVSFGTEEVSFSR